MSSSSVKRVAFAGVAVLAAMALGRAASFRFQTKQQVVRDACRADLQKLGLTRSAAKSKYPTPEIHMVSSGCLLPGSTGEVVVKGKFAPGTKIFIENDNIEVVQEALVGNEYRATVKVAPNVPPQTAAVVAITPVTCLTARHDRGVAIGGRFEWEMQAANGWRIVARPVAGKTCGGQAAEDNYDVQFFRKAEATPFEKRDATLTHSLYEGVNRFRVSSQDAGGQATMDQYMGVMRKISDPNLPQAEREKIMQQLEKMQEKIQAEASKMADPAYAKQIEARRQQFGCEHIEVKTAGTSLTGEMRCSQAVGTRIPITGTLKYLGK